MAGLQFTNSSIRAGVWYGTLVGSDAEPALDVRHLDQSVDGLSVTADGGAWHLSLPIPADAISDGVHTFTIIDTTVGETLTNFTLVAGGLLDTDIHAEVALLRAELDMLKRAFRRHCVETN